MFGADTLKTLDRWTPAKTERRSPSAKSTRTATSPRVRLVFFFERRPASAWPDASSKPAEEVYKNIQILKGLPAERLPVVMGLFAQSLNVKCSYCHVDGDFASDSKPTKQTARKMYEMVKAENRDSFGGADAVSCWMCHRGSVKPEPVPAPK